MLRALLVVGFMVSNWWWIAAVVAPSSVPSSAPGIAPRERGGAPLPSIHID
jgi:hypothetical protein